MDYFLKKLTCMQITDSFPVWSRCNLSLVARQPNIWRIQKLGCQMLIRWHLTGSIPIACRNWNLYTVSVKFLCRLHRLQHARCCYKWLDVDPKLLHTDTWHKITIKTPFHLPFLMSTIRLYLILTSFCWFLWNWVSFLSKTGGSLDLNLNKTLPGNLAGCMDCETHQGDSSVSRMCVYCKKIPFSLLYFLFINGMWDTAVYIFWHFSNRF